MNEESSTLRVWGTVRELWEELNLEDPPNEDLEEGLGVCVTYGEAELAKLEAEFAKLEVGEGKRRLWVE